MEESSRKGFFWNILGSGMVSASTVLLSMLVSAKADLSGIGSFSLALTTSQILYMVSLFGANDIQMTDFHGRYRFRDYAGVRMITLFIAAMGILSAFLLHFSAKAFIYTVILSIYMLTNGAAELGQSLFFQNRRVDLFGKSCFFRSLAAVIVFGLVLQLTKSVQIALTAMAAENLASVIILRNKASLFKQTDKEERVLNEKYGVRALFRETFPLGLSAICQQLIINCPRYLINHYQDESVQGNYYLLFLPVYVINLLSQFVVRPLLWRYEETLLKKRQEFPRMLLKHTAFILLLTIASAFAAGILGVWILLILFHQDVSAYQHWLALFVLAGGMLAANQLFYYILIILKDEKSIFTIYLISGMATCLAGMRWISRYEIGGAWAAFAVGQLVIAAGSLIRIMLRGKAENNVGKGKSNQQDEQL